MIPTGGPRPEGPTGRVFACMAFGSLLTGWSRAYALGHHRRHPSQCGRSSRWARVVVRNARVGSQSPSPFSTLTRPPRSIDAHTQRFTELHELV